MTIKHSKIATVMLVALLAVTCLGLLSILLPPPDVEAFACSHLSTRWVSAGCCACNNTKLKLQWCDHGTWKDTGTTTCNWGQCCNPSQPCCF